MDPMGRLETMFTAVAAFASTNVDDGLVLLAFLGDRRFSRRQIVAGQFLGMGALVAVSVGLAGIAAGLPEVVVRGLGLFPIGMGLAQLWTRRGESSRPPSIAQRRAGWISVAVVTVANGGDNIAVYVPLFARMNRADGLVTMGTFAALTAVWCAAAMWMINRAWVKERLTHLGPQATPWVLILLGLKILWGR